MTARKGYIPPTQPTMRGGVIPTNRVPSGPAFPETEQTHRQNLWRQFPLLVILVVLWVLLWDDITLMTIVTGTALALLVTRVFYLPPIALSGRLNPWRLLIFVGRMIYDIMVASVYVAWLAINPRYQPINSILAIKLHTRSDLVITLTAVSISLVPGTVVIDADREHAILYIHALGTRTNEDIDRIRREVLGTEERIVLAIGAKDEADEIRADRRQRDGGVGTVGARRKGD
ncbi:MAG TPA: Na+/H+ antiporter subunit E [Microterricola sp.]